MTRQILHIIPTLDRAGAEKQLVLLASGLPRDLFDIHVCAMTRGGPLEKDLLEAGIPTTVLGKRWKADPVTFWRLRKIIRDLQPDLVQTWLFAAGSYGRLAARSCGVRHLIHTERCVDRWKSDWQWMVDRQLARSTDRLIANARGVRDYCVQHGLPANKIDLIPNAVPKARPSDQDREALLDTLDIPHDARLIGAIGRLWPQKRIKDLIWAYELVVLLHPNARLLIIGDGPERAGLERYTRLVSSTEHVRFLGERSDVWRILPHLDVLWQGSDYEGMPNAVLEAMAAGVPVVATDIPGHREMIVSGETGYLVPIAGRADYGRATDRILSDPDHARQLGKQGQRSVEQEFTVGRMVDRYGQLYRKLLD
ncbi:MAG: glycosyltransferase [Pirellulales bacterium]|nr:glycosyltransferase [Pirellulales bacterium]